MNIIKELKSSFNETLNAKKDKKEEEAPIVSKLSDLGLKEDSTLLYCPLKGRRIISNKKISVIIDGSNIQIINASGNAHIKLSEQSVNILKDTVDKEIMRRFDVLEQNALNKAMESIINL